MDKYRNRSTARFRYFNINGYLINTDANILYIYIYIKICMYIYIYITSNVYGYPELFLLISPPQEAMLWDFPLAGHHLHQKEADSWGFPLDLHHFDQMGKPMQGEQGRHHHPHSAGTIPRNHQTLEVPISRTHCRNHHRPVFPMQ